MKKQTQVEMDSEDILEQEFSKSTKMSKENKAKMAQRKQDFVKYLRLVQIAGMVLATVLLAKQDNMYARVLGAFVGFTTIERIWLVTFRGK